MLILRCYPTISSLIYDLTGINIPLPIYSFGFFVALAFIAAAFTLVLELKRKEREGIFKAMEEKIKVGEAATPVELIFNAILGFILGFKLGGIVLNYSGFVDNPQEFIFSSEGNILAGIAVGALMAWSKYREKQKQLLPKPELKSVLVHPYQRIGDIVTLAAIFGILGAKIFSILETPGGFKEFFRDPLGNFFSGLTIYGGLIVGAAAVIWYAMRKNLSILHLGDATAPGLILAYGVGRMGCQVSGDGDWGVENLTPKPDWLSFLPDWAWAYKYAHNINREGIPIPGCEGPYCFELPNPVFPTPLYEITMALIIFAILWTFRKRIKIPGMLFSMYIFFNGVERFFIERIRVNLKYEILDSKITQAQIISTLFILTGIALGTFCYLRYKRQKA